MKLLIGLISMFVGLASVGLVLDVILLHQLELLLRGLRISSLSLLDRRRSFPLQPGNNPTLILFMTERKAKTPAKGS